MKQTQPQIQLEEKPPSQAEKEKPQDAALTELLQSQTPEDQKEKGVWNHTQDQNTNA